MFNNNREVLIKSILKTLSRRYYPQQGKKRPWVWEPVLSKSSRTNKEGNDYKKDINERFSLHMNCEEISRVASYRKNILKCIVEIFQSLLLHMESEKLCTPEL